MRLAEFILANVEPILAEWEVFARSILAGANMNSLALRDHAQPILAIEHAHALVKQQTAALEQAQVDLERTVIRAPSMLASRKFGASAAFN